MLQPEQQARQEIDRLLQAAGWAVQDMAGVNLHAAQGAAKRAQALRQAVLAKAFGG